MSTRVPVNRIFHEKRRIIVPMLIVLALNIALYALVVYPLASRVRNMEDREAAAMRELMAAEKDDAAARAVLEGRDRADVALKEFYKDVLPSSFAVARDITYLKLNQLADQHNIEIRHRQGQADTEKKGTLARLRVTMQLEGSYEDIRRFIYQLEAGSDFLVIDSVQLAQEESGGGPLALTLGISTYYRTEPHGA